MKTKDLPQSQPVDRPHIGWWASILFGMTLTGLLALNDATWGGWQALFGDALPRPVILWIFIVAVAIHAGEALYAYRLAARTGRPALGWLWQTFLLGIASLSLLHKQVRAGANPGAAS